MSRLESAIRRLQAQKASLDWAAAAIADVDGTVLELGLGNGRTYDHLRGLLPDRAIYVFDRQVNVHPTCVPPDDRLFLGDLADTIGRAVVQLGKSAALIHADLGSGRPDVDAQTTAILAQAAPSLLRDNGMLLSDQELPALAELRPIDLPPVIPAGRYFAYRRL